MLKVLFDPAPRTSSEIFSLADQQRFFNDYNVVVVDAENRERDYQQHLSDTDILVSQQSMDKKRLSQAEKLRAIINVETNFLPNVDYEYCFSHGIHVLTPASVFAVPVAELGLGMAISIARDIHSAHQDFIHSNEAYGLSGNNRAELLSGGNIGIVGFGDLGRAIRRLLTPFNASIRVFDPWLPDNYLLREGVEPCSFNILLEQSRVVFVTAAVTTENEHLFDAHAFARMPDGAMMVLLSRAALVDFDAMATEAASGRLRFATDVFPEEPVPKDSPLRKVPNILFSAHRAGALETALQQIGSLALEDIQQIAKGLPPVACRRAERETIGRLNSKPIEQS